MARILSLATDVPQHTVSASETAAFLGDWLPASQAARAAQMIDATGIRTRHTVAPLSQLSRLGTIDARNAVYEREAVVLAERVATRALERAAVDVSKVAAILVTSSTGTMIPTLDQHLVGRLGLRPDVRCLSLAGLGCSGGIRAVALASDLLTMAAPGQVAIVVGVDLCSIWLPVGEPSPEDVASTVIFGDGAGALVIGKGPSDRSPQVVASRTQLWPNSLEGRGAKLTSGGLRHFSSPALSRLVAANLRPTVEAFLASQGDPNSAPDFFAINPSDPRIIKAAGSVLGVTDRLLEPAWQVWRRHGNTLSAGPFFLLEALTGTTAPAPEDLGLLLALGPGITCEMLLLRWGQLATAP